MTQYTITVDTEEEWDWSSGYPTSRPSVKNIQALDSFQDSCDQHNAKVTYFVNYSVLHDLGSARIIAELSRRKNVEIGFHIHPWNTPPLQPREYVTPKESYLHNLPAELGIKKLETVLEAFHSLNISPTSFRGGRYSTCNWIQRHLHARGIIADASILPFTTWPDEGAPDFRERGLLPVRREPVEGEHGLWEIPLTLAFTRKPWTFFRRFYEVGEMSACQKLRLIGVAERTFVKRIWLNLEHPLGEHSVKLLKTLKREELPCINFTLHSSSLVPGLNAYTKTADDLDQLFRRLNSVLNLLRNWPQYYPATVTEVAQTLEKQHHANSGN